VIDFDATTLVAVRNAFAEPCTFRPGAGGAYAATGVFQKPYKRQSMDGDGNVRWVWAEPSAGIRLADLPATPTKADRFDFRGATYQVVEVHPDGVGWVNIILKATA
jgi:hypothetical protein